MAKSKPKLFILSIYQIDKLIDMAVEASWAGSQQPDDAKQIRKAYRDYRRELFVANPIVEQERTMNHTRLFGKVRS